MWEWGGRWTRRTIGWEGGSNAMVGWGVERGLGESWGELGFLLVDLVINMRGMFG